METIFEEANEERPPHNVLLNTVLVAVFDSGDEVNAKVLLIKNVIARRIHKYAARNEKLLLFARQLNYNII